MLPNTIGAHVPTVAIAYNNQASLTAGLGVNITATGLACSADHRALHCTSRALLVAAIQDDVDLVMGVGARWVLK
jgi:hypothetical protein